MLRGLTRRLHFDLNARAQNGTAQGLLLDQLVLDGTATGIQSQSDVVGSTGISSVALGGTKLLAAGHHTIAQTIFTIGTPSAAAQEPTFYLGELYT